MRGLGSGQLDLYGCLASAGRETATWRRPPKKRPFMKPEAAAFKSDALWHVTGCSLSMNTTHHCACGSCFLSLSHAFSCKRVTLLDVNFRPLQAEEKEESWLGRLGRKGLTLKGGDTDVGASVLAHMPTTPWFVITSSFLNHVSFFATDLLPDMLPRDFHRSLLSTATPQSSLDSKLK